MNVLPAVRTACRRSPALQKARQDTFDALNLPFVYTTTVMPRGGWWQVVEAPSICGCGQVLKR